MNKIDKNNTNQTLDNCISIVSKTLKDATDTSIEIKTQGEQFKKMDDMTEDIKDNTKKANGILDKMLSYVGYIRSKSAKKKIKNNQIIDESTLTEEDKYLIKIFESPDNPINRVAAVDEEELILEDFDEEQVIEDNLYVVSTTNEDKLQTLYNLTKQLKEVNLGINSALDQQNDHIDQLETKVEDRSVDIRQTNRKIKKFLR